MQTRRICGVRSEQKLFIFSRSVSVRFHFLQPFFDGPTTTYRNWRKSPADAERRGKRARQSERREMELRTAEESEKVSSGN